MFDMSLLSQYKDIKVTFSQNVLYYMKDDFYFFVENKNSQTMPLAGFSQRGSHLFGSVVVSIEMCCSAEMLTHASVWFFTQMFVLY